MTPDFLARINWDRPWLEPLRATAAPILASADWRQALNQQAAIGGLRNHRNLPLSFVPQAALPPDTAYEAYISATGNIPTRNNLHDFFNALVWLTYPAIKRQLNALQAAEIMRRQSEVAPSTSGRGKLRDAATIFDENAALLVTADMALVDALRNHRWQEAFLTRRAAFGPACEVRLFGHALMEKLIAPYKAITAHAWLVQVDAGFFSLMPQERDTWLNAQVTRQLAEGLVSTDFTPLPVLGVPGWWLGQDNAFYADATVFRTRRTAV